jgi:hypothetical protein
VAARHDDGLIQERMACHTPAVVARPLQQTRSCTHPLGSAVPVVLLCPASGRRAARSMRLSASRDGHGLALATLPLGLGLPTHCHGARTPLATPVARAGAQRTAVSAGLASRFRP